VSTRVLPSQKYITAMVDVLLEQVLDIMSSGKPSTFVSYFHPMVVWNMNKLMLVCKG
jgi:hypothetical protein